MVIIFEKAENITMILSFEQFGGNVFQKVNEEGVKVLPSSFEEFFEMVFLKLSNSNLYRFL